MEELDNRVAHLEFRADATDEKMKLMEGVQKNFGEGLAEIQKVLVQIKYALYGAGLAVAVNYLGIKDVIAKLVLHA
jgi:predicted histidine transporter YuiF (NhaC family)